MEGPLKITGPCSIHMYTCICVYLPLVLSLSQSLDERDGPEGMREVWLDMWKTQTYQKQISCSLDELIHIHNSFTLLHPPPTGTPTLCI